MSEVTIGHHRTSESTLAFSKFKYQIMPYADRKYVSSDAMSSHHLASMSQLCFIFYLVTSLEYHTCLSHSAHIALANDINAANQSSNLIL